jgi:hypothetical protein
MSQASTSALGKSFGKERIVQSVNELMEATADRSVQIITLTEDLFDVPEIRLSPNTTLRGRPNHRPVLRFAEGVDGLCLSSDNLVKGLDLLASPERLAVRNDQSVSSLGILTLRSLATVGRVSILAKDAVPQRSRRRRWSRHRRCRCTLARREAE